MTASTALDRVRAIEDREARIHAATEYIRAGEAKVQEARRLRDDDVRALADEIGPAKAARVSGLALSTVKGIRRGASASADTSQQ